MDDAGVPGASPEHRFPRLGDPAAAERALVGGKAAALSRLRAEGFPVPAGFVVTSAALAAGVAGPGWDKRLREAARAAGPGPYAVRSSAAAEDLPDASYAGQYESYLGVDAAGLASAVARCFESAETNRVRSYQASRGGQDGHTMAVLVQQMVDAAAAGVAFSADPLTGARDQVVVSAVPGLAERLVSGSAGGEDWTVRGGRAIRTGGTGVLTEQSATAVAAAVRKVAALFGVPQDVEWALDRSGHLQLVQARPMTALPQPVVWQPPGKGVWLRNFRLGEWLPEPVTPLFMDWLVPRLDAAYNRAVFRSAGISVTMGHAAVNGWYYVAPPTPRALPHLLFGGSRRSLPYIFNSVVRPMLDPAGADRAVLHDLEREWRDDCLPRYRKLAATDVAEAASLPVLIGLVEEVARAAGEFLWYLSAAGGAAWKMEVVLARFWRRHIARNLPALAPAAPDGGGYQVLLGGLLPSPPPVPPHAVYSLDWYHPTLGEEAAARTDQGTGPVERPGAPQLAAGAVQRRKEAEAACRSALSGTRHLRRFDSLLAVARHYALLREEQAREFTLGWPLLRRCAALIGVRLQQAGVIASPGDVFFLTRQELRTDAPSRDEEVARRRGDWLQQRKLDAPLILGGAPLLGNTFDRIANGARSSRQLPEGAITGHPASPGRARGRVRLVDGPDDFALFRPGEVLVAKATAPAWTPLFADAAAVVTDTGNLAAHASLVAREYGIPAVVGTGNATHLLHTGQRVTVDGSKGIIETHEG
ncbi:PEP/pyruvate-binding domain-containing protein [Arthrobacter sp. AD-310]